MNSKKTSALFLALLICLSLASKAQIGTNLTFFTQDGQPFFLIIDGVKQNDKAQANVKVTGLTQPSIQTKFIFKDETIKPLDERFYLTGVDPGPYNITYAIRWNDKKKRMQTKMVSWESITVNASNSGNNNNNTIGANRGGSAGGFHQGRGGCDVHAHARRGAP